MSSTSRNFIFWLSFYLKNWLLNCLMNLLCIVTEMRKTTYSLGQFLTFIFTIVNYILFFKDYISKHIAHRKAFVHEPRLRDLYYNLSAKRFCNIIHMAGSCIYYRIFRAVYLEIYMIVKSIGAYHPRWIIIAIYSGISCHKHLRNSFLRFVMQIDEHSCGTLVRHFPDFPFVHCTWKILSRISSYTIFATIRRHICV